jgi:hypothetical protein
MPSILPRSSLVNPPGYALRYAQSEIFSASALRVAVFHYTLLVTKHSPDRTGVQFPKLGEVLRSVVDLKSEIGGVVRIVSF